ncbi:unnamed protein product [Coffea canephora]|uniref:Uncharacterized protein n=1 Tax=Coffea canephora TaxID=49390 RepID=A0A068ULB5_COFCA|nr:unnamed protein product [Coffea canephora]
MYEILAWVYFLDFAKQFSTQVLLDNVFFLSKNIHTPSVEGILYLQVIIFHDFNMRKSIISI